MLSLYDMRALILFFLFININTLSSKAIAITWLEYQSTKNIATHITKNYPPDQYIYIGVGASPTAILAFIETLYGASQVSHLPLSGTLSTRNHHLNTTEQKSNYEENLKKHFERFLSAEKLGNRKILLIDFANTGEGLIYAFEKVLEYAQAKGLTQSIEALGLAKNSSVKHRLKSHNIESFPLSWFIRSHFQDRKFDEYRKYDGFVPTYKRSGEHYTSPHLITNQLKAERLMDFYRRSGYKDEDLRELRNDPDIHRNLQTYPNLIKEMNDRIKGDPILKYFMGNKIKRRGNPLAPYCRQLFYFPL